jgi:phytoene dehydrogenase-like protein
MNMIARTGDARPHAIVIGSGFGGLAAAIRLGARGYRVTVLERLDAPGGRAYVHHQDGFTFDAGPTIVTAPFLLDELWALCGQARDVELRPLDPFYRLHFPDGSTFAACDDPARMRAEVARLNPADVGGYDSFMRHSAEACRIGFEQLGDQPFDSFMDMVRVAPALLKLGGWKSVYSVVAEHFKRRAAAHRLLLPPAADRRQSLRRQRHLLADLQAGAALGRPLGHGRHRRAGGRASQAHRRARAAGCAATRTCSRSRCATAAPPAC